MSSTSCHHNFKWASDTHVECKKCGLNYEVQMSDEGDGMSERTCVQHGDQIIYEPGGDNMPTIHGRRYCPTCQTALHNTTDATDAQIEAIERWIEAYSAARPQPTDADS